MSTPMEKVLGEISGVKHIYSVSRPGLSVLTVQYEVGIHRNDAIVRLYNAVYSNQDWRPAGVGILQPLIKPKGIDDVPIVTLTMWSRNPALGAHELGKIARATMSEIKRVPGTRNVYSVGDNEPLIRVELDPGRLTAAGLTAADLTAALQAANLVRQADGVLNGNLCRPCRPGHSSPAATMSAASSSRPATASRSIWTMSRRSPTRPDPPRICLVRHRPGRRQTGHRAGQLRRPPSRSRSPRSPAPMRSTSPPPSSIRVDQLKGITIPAGVEVTVTRNYGVTANDKATKLIEKLLFATASVVLLVLLAVGKREAVVVGTAVIVTLAATLFASWAWGFTINRVSLFALIFSIGILVDDAIVIVENVHRHLAIGQGIPRRDHPDRRRRGGRSHHSGDVHRDRRAAADGLRLGADGPLYGSDPDQREHGDADLARHGADLHALDVPQTVCQRKARHVGGGARGGQVAPLLRPPDDPLLDRRRCARKRRHRLYLGTAGGHRRRRAARGVSTRRPEDAALRQQVGVPGGRQHAGGHARSRARPACSPDWRPLCDTYRKSPITRPMRVRRRRSISMAWCASTICAATPTRATCRSISSTSSDRSRKSHEIARAIRPALAAEGKRLGAASVQVVEVPPGPPVQAPLVAEIYGPTYAGQEKVGHALRAMFDATKDIVDTDDTLERARTPLCRALDRAKAALLGVSQAQVADALATALGGQDATFIHSGRERDPIAVRLELGSADKQGLEQALALPVRSASGALVPLSEVVSVSETPWDPTDLPQGSPARGIRHRRHGRPTR